MSISATTFLACSLLLLNSELSRACQICIPFPRTSATDLLLAGESIVLAREDPEHPFHYRTIEVLQGNPGREQIDLFLNSSTRRMLAVYPERSMVLVKQIEDGKSVWHGSGIADTEFGPLVREILKAGAAWEAEPQKRVAFFCKLLGHDHPEIRKLALIEVARAPYRDIRKMNGVLARDQIHAFLNNHRYIEWHALYILLLAQSDDPRDHELISESFRSAARFGTTIRLAPWATAAIELEGVDAVKFIETEYFHKTTRSATELLEVTKALSVHGSNGPPELQDRIVTSYGALLELNPGMTARVAEDLIAWKRTEYATRIAKFLADNPLSFDLPTTLNLRAYALRAHTQSP